MARAYIDVMLEVPVRELAAMPDPTREMYERMRTKADAMCAEAGARLRTDSAPEVVVKQGHSALIGDVTLVASRWAVDAPEALARTL